MRSIRVLLPTLVAGAALFSAACADAAPSPDPQRSGRVKLPSPKKIEGDPVKTLLPPDGIPAIDEPRFVSASEADFMRDDEPIVGVVHAGEAKAYSLWHLDHHEIVNDRFGDDPVAVTW